MKWLVRKILEKNWDIFLFLLISVCILVKFEMVLFSGVNILLSEFDWYIKIALCELLVLFFSISSLLLIHFLINKLWYQTRCRAYLDKWSS